MIFLIFKWDRKKFQKLKTKYVATIPGGSNFPYSIISSLEIFYRAKERKMEIINFFHNPDTRTERGKHIFEIFDKSGVLDR